MDVEAHVSAKFRKEELNLRMGATRTFRFLSHLRLVVLWNNYQAVGGLGLSGGDGCVVALSKPAQR